MSVLIKSNARSTNNMGSIFGLQGPQDFRLMADFSIEEYRVDGERMSFEDLFVFTRPSQAWLINDREEIETYAVNEARIGRVGGYRGVVVERSSTGNAYPSGSNPVDYTTGILGSAQNWSIRVWGEGTFTANVLSSEDVLQSSTVIRASQGYTNLAAASGRKVEFLVDDIKYVQMAPNGIPYQFIARDGDALVKSVERLQMSPAYLSLFAGSFTFLLSYAVDTTTSMSGLHILALNSAADGVISARAGTRPGGGMMAVLDYGSTSVSADAVPTYMATALVSVDRDAETIKLSLGGEVATGAIPANFDVTSFYLGSTASETLTGIIRKATIFDRALTDQEINAAKLSFR